MAGHILKVDDEFQAACAAHDAAYEDRLAGRPTPSLAEVDRAFLGRMLSACEGRAGLRCRAYLFYGLARLWGLTARRKLWRWQPRSGGHSHLLPVEPAVSFQTSGTGNRVAPSLTGSQPSG